jgi:Zn-dependent M28 family amino/carboxypeptidase
MIGMRWARGGLPVLMASLFAQAAPAAPAADSAKFDSSRAFEHVRQLVAIGPRPAGSPGNEQARAYIVDQLKALGLSPTLQQFSVETPLGTSKMANVVVKIPGADAERILITGHFDTKLVRQFRFVGATDGGSSAAMRLELARVLKDRKNPYTIELVFFDGEEATLPEWTGTDHTYGSRHYVDAGKADGSLSKIRAMILFDMVADRSLNIRRETYSTRWLTDLIWASARKLGHADSFIADGFPVEDDHKAFLDAGVPSVDIIDLDYSAWHTERDTLDAISARSLQIVGDTFLDALPKIEARSK